MNLSLSSTDLPLSNQQPKTSYILQQYSRDQENMPNMMNISDYTPG